MVGRARVLIVDDHPLVREGLAARISAHHGMEVCGEAADVDEATALLHETKPDLVIVDLALKRGHGLDLIAQVRKTGLPTRILVVSAYEDSLFAERALRAGAHGFINKQEAQENVILAIRTVLRGDRYLDANMTQRLLDRAIEDPRARLGVESLTNRELEVFELIGRGKSTRAIADQLGLSIHTVESHRDNIRMKLALNDGAELARRAVEWALQRR